MKLYVANTTKQIQELHFRVPESIQVMREIIPVGEQRRVFKEDATRADIDYIVEQISRYGAIRSADRPEGFNGLCYSIDKPVSGDAIQGVVEHNDDVLEERGVEMRKASAIAVADQAGINDRALGLKEVEVTLKEDSKPGDTDDKIDQTVSVVREGQTKRSRK